MTPKYGPIDLISGLWINHSKTNGYFLAKKADGFELKFTHRGSWMVERSADGRPIDVIPVAWARDFRTDTHSGRKFQKVNYQRSDELERL